MIYQPDQMYLLVHLMPAWWWFAVVAVVGGMSDVWGWSSGTRTDAVARGVMRAAWVSCLLLLVTPASSGWLFVVAATAAGGAVHRVWTTWPASREQFGTAVYVHDAQEEK